MKKCAGCKKYKALDSYYSAAYREDGYVIYCNECSKQKSRDYRKNNK